jgi:MATE family multidrug resistance protein
MLRDRQSTLSRLIVIAFPMVVSQTSDTIMLFTDRLFVSRLGEEYLAASMAGGLTQFMMSSFFLGMVGYVNAIVAQYYGARRTEHCARATFQAVLLSFAAYPVLLAVSPLVRYFFVFAGHSPRQIELGYLYYSTLIFGSIFSILRTALTGFFLGIGRTTVVMLSNLVGMLVNLPANYLLIYGKFGFPAMGLRGAAIGTVIGAFATFAILAAFYLNRANRTEFGTHRARSFDPVLFRKLLGFGVPVGFEQFLNVAAFNTFVQFMHSYGTIVAAAVTITFNWDVVVFIPMLGLGYATTALVGQNIGANDLPEAKRTAYTALKVAWGYAAAMGILFVTTAPALVRVFVSGFESGGREVSSIAVTMIRLAALYTLADATQLMFAGALKGAGDTKWVMRISVALHWVFAAVAVFMIRGLRAAPTAVWIAFILFVLSMGVAMFARFKLGRWTEIELIGDVRTAPQASSPAEESV